MNGEIEERRRTRRRKCLPILLMALFLAFVLSSGMVGFLLGRNAARSSGRLMDTIVLSPGNSSRRQGNATVHFLSGTLHRHDGQPLEGATVRLGDGDRSDVTDSRGRFYLSDIRSGEQVLEVEDASGTVKCSMTLSLDFSGSAVSVSVEQNAIQMPEETRLVEMSFTLGKDDSLVLEADSVCAVTRSGQVVNGKNKALRLASAARAITPGGSLVDSQGYVAVPYEGVVLTPAGQQVVMDVGVEIMPGVLPVENSSLLLLPTETEEAASPEDMPEPSAAAMSESGALLLLDGTLQLEDGTTLNESDKVILMEDGAAQELEELVEEYVPPAEETSAPSEAPESEASDPGEAEPTPAPTVRGLEVSDLGTGLSWEQQFTIALFQNRVTENGTEIKSADGSSIQPGDQGYYDFRLENPEDFDITYTVTIKEKTFHLPILYSVVDLASNRSYLRRERNGDGMEELVSPEITIPAQSVQEFRIEWAWQYRDWLDVAADDALDTAAAEGDQPYEVSLRITAEQVIPIDWPDGDIRYPGIRSWRYG